MNDNLKTNFDPREIKGLFAHEQNDPKKGEGGSPWKEVFAKESKDRPICFSWDQLPVHDENGEILGALHKICDDGQTFDMYFVMSINRSEVAYFKATIVDFATTPDEYNAKYSKWKSENPKSSRIQSKFSDYGYGKEKIVFLASFEPLDGDKRIPLKNFIIYKDMHYNPRGNIVAYTKILTDNEIKTKEMIDDYVNLLKEKKNLILQGAPGTGKTYRTAEIAVRLLDGEGAVLADHKTVMRRYDELRKSGQIFFTTFHQSMDYEDFVEGMMPKLEGSEVTYGIEDGIFKRACKAVHSNIEDCIDDYINKIRGWENKQVIPTKTGGSSIYVWLKGKSAISVQSVNSMSERDDSIASLNIKEVKERALKGENFKCDHHSAYIDAFVAAVKQEYGIKEQEKPVVLIIDEINRGNVSKIFGELITLIEVDKREWGEDESNGKHPIEVMLPYSKESFSVPSNLYIIGTMNTTDRSTGTLDYALRRRFAFYTLKSDVNVVKGHYPSNDKLGGKAVALFENIEKFIISKYCGDYDVDDLMVGHSYFMAKDENELRDKMKYEVIPLIKEYINDGILNVSRGEAKKYTDEWCKLNVVEIKETRQKLEGEGTESDLGGSVKSASDTSDTVQQNG